MAKKGKLTNLFTTALLISVLIIPPAFSQNFNTSDKLAFDFNDLNKVKDLVPSKTPEPPKTVVPAPTPNPENTITPQDNNQQPTQPENPTVKKVERPKLIYKQFKPAIAYGRLLRESIKLFKDGNFYFWDVVGVFLPDKDKDGKDVLYGWFDDSNHEMLAVLKDSKGNILMKTPYMGRNSESSPPFLLMSSMPDGSNPDMEKAGFKNKIKLGAGSYIVEFYLDNDVFYKMPFSVKKLASGTAYNPNDVWVAEGPWNEYGYLYYDNADPNNQLNWNIYLRNSRPDVNATTQTLNIKINLKNSAGKVVAKATYPTYDIGLREWERCGFLLTTPNDTMYFARDLLKVNGKYQVEVIIDNKKSVYPFEIKNHKIQYQGKQVREKTDPLRYIEGGIDTFWIQKQGGTYK